MKKLHIATPNFLAIKKTGRIAKYIIASLIPVLIWLASMLPSYTLFAASSTLVLFTLGIILSVRIGDYKSGLVTTILSSIFILVSNSNGYDNLGFNNVELIFTILLFSLQGILLSILLDRVLHDNITAEYKKGLDQFKNKNDILLSDINTLKKEIRQRDEFLSVASHELKTPLTSMLLQTQHALHNIKNVSMANFSIENLLKMLESVENQTRRLSKMINDLLNISQITSGNLQLELEMVDLNRTVQDIIDDYAPRIQRDKYVVSLIKEKEIEGKWDKVRIEQAISNLVSNALKYGKGNPIKINLKKRGDKAEIIVEDRGIGISNKLQKKIFDLFERGVSPDEFKGLGVGLYITKKIINAHNGNISVTSKPNQGSTFTILLPLNKK